MDKEIKDRINAIRQSRIPKGYNRNRYMLYPEDWDDPCPLYSVLTENKERNEDLEYDKDDVLSVSGDYGVVNQIDLLGRSYAGESVAPYHIVYTGDIVYTKSPLKDNPHGIIKLNKGNPGIVSTLYAVYHCNNDITAQYIENYFCIDSYLNNYLKPIVKRGAKNDMKVNNEDVLTGVIPLPPLAEQKKISEILDHYDKLIKLCEAKANEYKSLKKTCLSKMFPQNGSNVPELRFPGFTEAWEQREVGDFTNVLSASRVHKNEWKTEGIPFYRSSDVVSAFKGADNEKAYISLELYEKLIKSSGRLETGDILITGGGSIGIPYIVPNNEPLYSKDADLIWVKKSFAHDSKYLYTYFTAQRFREYINSISHVGTIAHYTIEQVKETPVLLPTIEEQKMLGGFFANLDNLITLHQREVEEYTKFKKAMTQLLLTGIVRV